MFSLGLKPERVATAHVYWLIAQNSGLCENGVDLDTCYNRKEEERPLESTRHAERHHQQGLRRSWLPSLFPRPPPSPSRAGYPSSPDFLTAHLYRINHDVLSCRVANPFSATRGSSQPDSDFLIPFDPHTSRKTRRTHQYPTSSRCTLLQTKLLSWKSLKRSWSKPWPDTIPLMMLSTVSVIRRKTSASSFPVFHDAYLVQRVRKTALKLASDPSISSRSPDLLVVELSALLHDVLDKKYVPESLSSDPYAFFLPMFEELDTNHPSVGLLAENGRRARLIADIVTNVSWTTEKKLRQEGKWGAWHDGCVELHCVQDADRLDAIGAFGTSAI
jgi:hypothetical protein